MPSFTTEESKERLGMAARVLAVPRVLETLEDIEAQVRAHRNAHPFDGRFGLTWRNCETCLEVAAYAVEAIIDARAALESETGSSS